MTRPQQLRKNLDIALAAKTSLLQAAALRQGQPGLPPCPPGHICRPNKKPRPGWQTALLGWLYIKYKSVRSLSGKVWRKGQSFLRRVRNRMMRTFAVALLRRVIRKLRAVWCQITINKQYLFLAGQLAAHTDEMRREIYELKKALWENADISFTQLEIAIQTKDNTPSAEPMQGQNTSSALPRPPNLPIPPSVTSVEGEEIDRDQQLIWHLSQLDKLGYRPGNRVAVNCGPDQILVRTQVGYVFCSAHDPVVLCALAETGELEHGTRLAIQRILQPGETFIDVGAHLGLHTIAAARVLKDHGRVIAFEPFPLTCSLLRKSVELNNLSSLVEIHNAAVSNRAESRPLFLGSISGHHSLFPLPDEEKAGVAPVEVPTMRLDQVIEPGQKADMIKIDAEGAELDVLEGARTLIEANPEIVLVVEFGPSHLRRVGHMPSDWLARFADLGLIYRVINEQTGNLESWPYHKLLDVYSVNLLFARPDASVWQRS